MTFYELEVAAYAAAHKIYTGLPTPDRACPGGYRSAVIDQIAEAIKQAFSVHFSLALSESSSSPEVERVRHSEISDLSDADARGHGWITGTADIDALEGQGFQEDITPEVESIRHSELSIPVYVANEREFWDGIRALEQTRHWRTLRHAFDMGGGHGTLDRPCLKCAMPHRFAMHFSPSWEPLQPVHVEPTASDEATIRGEAKP